MTNIDNAWQDVKYGVVKTEGSFGVRVERRNLTTNTVVEVMTLRQGGEVAKKALESEMVKMGWEGVNQEWRKE